MAHYTLDINLIHRLLSQLGPDTIPPLDRGPLTLDEEIRALYERAVADSSSLTADERRNILDRLLQEEEDALCRDTCGLTMSELITKTIEQSQSLTYTETTLILGGPVRGVAGKGLNQRVQLSEAERNLSHKAEEAARAEADLIARKNS